MADGRNLPKYEQSVAAEVTGQPDVAGTYNNLIGAFQRFSSTVAEISSDVSKQAALQQREILQHNISTTYRQFANQALNEPDPNKALANYDESVNSYNQQLLKQTGTFNKSYVSSLTDYYSELHRDPIFKNSLAANKRTLQGQFAEYDNTQTQDVNDAVAKSQATIDPETGVNLQFAPAIALYKNQQRSRQQAFTNGNIPSVKAYEAGQKQSYESLMQGIAIKSYKDHLIAGKGDEFWKDYNSGKYADQLEDAGLPRPSEKQLEITGNILRSVQKQFQTQVGYDKTSLRQHMANDIEAVQDGAVPNENVAENVRIVFPNEVDSYNARIKGAQEIHSIKRDALYSSPSAITQKVEELKPTDVNDPLYHEKKHAYEVGKAAVLQQEKNIQADPMKYAQNDPTVKAAAQHSQVNADIGMEGTNFQGTPFNLQSPSATDAAMNWQTVKGIPMSKQRVMTNDQAKEMVSAFDISDDAGKIGLFSTLREQFPTDVKYRLAVKHLVDSGMNADYSTLVNYDMNDPEARRIVQAIGVDVSVQKKQLPNKIVEQVDALLLAGKNTSFYHSYINTPRMASYWNSIRALQTTDAGQFAGQVDSSMQHLTYYALTSGIATTPEKAYQWASDRVTHGMQFGSYDGQTLRAPAGIEMANIYSYADHQQRTALHQFQFAVPKVLANQNLLAGGNAKKFHEDYLRTIRSGHFATNDTMTGLVWSTPNGEIPTDKNGHPFEFLYKDAKNYTDNSIFDTVDTMNNALMGKPQPKDYSPDDVDPSVPTVAPKVAPTKSAVATKTQAPTISAETLDGGSWTAEEKATYEKAVKSGKKGFDNMSPEMKKAIRGDK
jgi:hypothetical protein